MILGIIIGHLGCRQGIADNSVRTACDKDDGTFAKAGQWSDFPFLGNDFIPEINYVTTTELLMRFTFGLVLEHVPWM